MVRAGLISGALIGIGFLLNHNKELASDAFKLAQPELHRGVTRGVLLKNTVARKLSRLSKGIKAISA